MIFIGIGSDGQQGETTGDEDTIEDSGERRNATDLIIKTEGVQNYRSHEDIEIKSEVLTNIAMEAGCHGSLQSGAVEGTVHVYNRTHDPKYHEMDNQTDIKPNLDFYPIVQRSSADDNHGNFSNDDDDDVDDDNDRTATNSPTSSHCCPSVPGTSLQCHVCCISFDSRQELELHCKISHRTCLKCCMTFKTEADFRDHAMRVHRLITYKEHKKVTDIPDERGLKQKEDRLKQEGDNTKQEKTSFWHCTKCCTQYKAKNEEKHLEKHCCKLLTIQKYSRRCWECKDGFHQDYTLFRHVDTEHGGLKERDKLFGQLTEKSYELSLPQFKCEICGRRFFKRVDLRFHLKICGFPCIKCQISFICKNDFYNHLGQKHEMSVGEFKFPTLHRPGQHNVCHLCHIHFLDTKKFEDHVGKCQLFSCCFCEQKFFSLEKLEDHYKMCESRSEVCFVCRKNFPHKTRLLTHLQNLHLQPYIKHTQLMQCESPMKK